MILGFRVRTYVHALVDLLICSCMHFFKLDLPEVYNDQICVQLFPFKSLERTRYVHACNCSVRLTIYFQMTRYVCDIF
jgi:hypothetical protein